MLSAGPPTPYSLEVRSMGTVKRRGPGPSSLLMTPDHAGNVVGIDPHKRTLSATVADAHECFARENVNGARDRLGGQTQPRPGRLRARRLLAPRPPRRAALRRQPQSPLGVASQDECDRPRCARVSSSLEGVTWRPPTARNQPDDRFDNLHEGVPSWLAPPLIAWVESFLVHYSDMGDVYYEVDVMHDMELAARFDPPLPQTGGRDALGSITERFRDDSPQAIDILDFLLGRLPRYFSRQDWDLSAVELKRILEAGGSIWDVTTGEERERGARYQLTRRVAGPVVEAVVEVGALSERAGEHLREAWKQLLGVHPDPSAAYQSAVAAVE